MNDELKETCCATPRPFFRGFIIHHSAFIISESLWLFCRRKQKSHRLKDAAQSLAAAPAIVKRRFYDS
jgi:hypothetical protein